MTTQNKPQPKFKIWDRVKAAGLYFTIKIIEYRSGVFVYSNGSNQVFRESDLELVEEQKEEHKKIKVYAYLVKYGDDNFIRYYPHEVGGMSHQRSPDHDIYY